MMAQVVVTSPRVAEPACSPAMRVTRSLLGYGVLAGPVYVVAVLVQAMIRPGFNLLRHDVSLLSNGSLGWIQVANFILTGAMVVAFAVGLRRALAGGRGAMWAPILVGLYGLGMIGAGMFVADPMNGFPAGAPAGRPSVITTHGLVHIACAGIGFIGLVAGCFVVARRFAAESRRAWSMASVATGVIFLAAFAGVASGSSSPAIILAFWAGLLCAWAWMAALAVHLYRRVSTGDLPIA